MQEYRWLLHNSAARIIGTDRGRFLTDDDAVAWAVGLLDRHALATMVEIWRDARLIGRRRRSA
jgi:hypothetical protein